MGSDGSRHAWVMGGGKERLAETGSAENQSTLPERMCDKTGATRHPRTAGSMARSFTC